jgi:GNAT superfamily N-acetyltransferase
MTKESELLEANRQFIGSAALLCGTFPRGELVEMPGLIAAWCDCPIPFLNTIFLTSPVQDLADLETRATALGDYLRGKRQPPLLLVCREWMPESLWAAADDAFGRAGVSFAITLTGMATDALSPAVHSATLQWRNVEDQETRNHVSDINAAAYGIPVEPMRAALALPDVWTEDFAGHVGLTGNEAVATAAVMKLNGALHVMCVATMPGHQKHGYAEAVMRYSLEQAARTTGLSRTTLHATEAGKPVYLRMGYHETATFTGYMRPHG